MSKCQEKEILAQKDFPQITLKIILQKYIVIEIHMAMVPLVFI